MTAREIQASIMSCRYRRSMCLPNYTPLNWFECDVFELTKAGMMREYEIKLTRADFMADKAKAKERGEWTTLPNGRLHYERQEGETKHHLLARSYVKGPTRFYFVAPRGLLTLDDIPPWAGFITAARRDPPYENDRLFMRMEREAPQIHRCRSLPEVRDHAGSVCYWRYLELLMKGK